MVNCAVRAKHDVMCYIIAQVYVMNVLTILSFSDQILWLSSLHFDYYKKSMHQIKLIMDKSLISHAPIDHIIGMLEYNGCKPARCNDHHQKQHHICLLITFLKNTMIFNRECELGFLYVICRKHSLLGNRSNLLHNLPYGINP